MKRGKGRRGKGPSREVKKKPTKKKAGPLSRPQPYEFLDHPADVGFRARGRSLEEVFAAAAQAMCDYGWELNTVRARDTVDIRTRAATPEDLLYSWLSEVLFLCDAEQWVFKSFTVEEVKQPAHSPVEKAKPDEGLLWEVRGHGQGERFDKRRHRSRTYIKAVTYHQLAVEQRQGTWYATIYLDV